MRIHQIISPAHNDTLPVAGGVPNPWLREDLLALETALRDMKVNFSSDFVEGRMGHQHNTFQHRARIIRQLTNQLDEQRARLS
jgi:hypothetical protein